MARNEAKAFLQEEHRVKVTCVQVTPMDYKKECDYLVCTVLACFLPVLIPLPDCRDQEGPVMPVNVVFALIAW